MAADVWGWDKAMCGVRGVRREELHYLLVTGAGGQEGRPCRPAAGLGMTLGTGFAGARVSLPASHTLVSNWLIPNYLLAFHWHVKMILLHPAQFHFTFMYG